MEISLLQARKRIATVWVTGAIVLILFFLIQTLTGHYENIEKEAWGWLLPNIIPGLGFILGIISIDVRNHGTGPSSTIDKTFYNISLYISLFYFVVFLLIIVCYTKDSPILSYYTKFNILLAPLQGVVTAATGIVFFKKDS